MVDSQGAEQPRSPRALHQNQTKAFLARLAESQGMQFEQFKEPEKRIALFKSLSTPQILELLTITNSKLRGEYKRWFRDYQDKKQEVVVSSGFQETPELDPPNNPTELLDQFFTNLKNEITPDNYYEWAAKAYTAVIFLHMFPDGNGRLARNAFSFLATGDLIDDTVAENRPYLIDEYSQQINRLAVNRVLKDDKNTRFASFSGNFYVASDNPHVTSGSPNGLNDKLKFVAARRAGIIKERAKNGDESSIYACYANGETHGISGEEYYEEKTNPWTFEEQARFRQEYSKVKDEWFWKSQSVLDNFNPLPAVWIDIGLTIPNDPGLSIQPMLKLLQAVKNYDKGTVQKILADPRESNLRTTDAINQFLTKIEQIVAQRPDLISRISKLEL